MTVCLLCDVININDVLYQLLLRHHFGFADRLWLGGYVSDKIKTAGRLMIGG